jgi:hypothetical protein
MAVVDAAGRFQGYIMLENIAELVMRRPSRMQNGAK